MAQYKLIDVASVIRSKNSGPFELTFDVIFKDFDMYSKGNKSNHCSSYSIWFIRRNRCLWCTTAYAFDEDELRIIK